LNNKRYHNHYWYQQQLLGLGMHYCARYSCFYAACNKALVF